MKKLFRIKNAQGRYWSTMSVVPSWSEVGLLFDEEQLKHLLKQFKYQRTLWPADAEVIELEVAEEKQSDKHTEIFAKIEEDLTFEKLKGSNY